MATPGASRVVPVTRHTRRRGIRDGNPPSLGDGVRIALFAFSRAIAAADDRMPVIAIDEIKAVYVGSTTEQRKGGLSEQFLLSIECEFCILSVPLIGPAVATWEPRLPAGRSQRFRSCRNRSSRLVRSYYLLMP